MNLAFGFHPAARAEFVADADWYDERDAGVGARFVAAIREALMLWSARRSRGRMIQHGIASQSCDPRP